MALTVRPTPALRVVKPTAKPAAAAAATTTSAQRAPQPAKAPVKAQGPVGKAGWLVGSIAGGLLGGYAGFAGGSAIAGLLAFLGVASFPIIAIPTIVLGALGAFLGGSLLGSSGLIVDWLIPNKKGTQTPTKS